MRSRPRHPLCPTCRLLVLTFLCAVGVAAADDASPLSPYVQGRLYDAGLIKDEDLVGYLRSYYRDRTTGNATVRLIEQLGDRDWRTREQATQRLVEMPDVDVEALQRAARSEDVEVQMRAQKVIRQRAAGHRLPIIEAVLNAIARKGVRGAAPELLKIASLDLPSGRADTVRAAAAATAREKDAAIARSALKSPDPVVRSVAVILLGAGGGADRGEVRKLFDDPSPDVRLAAAWAAAKSGDAACRPALAALLDSDAPAVRSRAVTMLRRVTGEQHGFSAADAPERRAAAVKIWREWLDGPGANRPVGDPGAWGIAPAPVGRILVADFNGGRVREYDLEGNVTWEVACPRAYAVRGLPDGSRLVGSFDGKYVAEYDRDGDLLWKKENLPGGVMSIQRLDNGHTLVACSDADVVLELDRERNVHWRAGVSGRPVQAQRLPDGNTLVCLHEGKAVKEIAPDGTVEPASVIENLPNPQSAWRGRDGRMLLALYDAGRVELRNGRRVVRTWGNAAKVVDAQRLSDGTVLFMSQMTGLHILDEGGARSLFSIPQSVYGRFHRY